MPSKYLNDARTGELIQKIYTADRAVATECKSYTDTNYLPLTGGTITGNLTVSGTITGDVTGNADSATNDANGNPIASTYLPLSGGTLTGDLSITPSENYPRIYTDADNKRLSIVGGSKDSQNPAILLYGKDYSYGGSSAAAGEFLIKANNGSANKELVGKPDGTLTWDGNDITPQKYSSATTSSDVSVPNATIKNLMTFTLSKGTWVVQVIANFPANATGYRMYGISSGATQTYSNRFYGVNVQANASGNPTIVPLTTIISVSSNTTFYLNAYHTAGTTLNVGAGYRVFRVSSIN